jgi:hypothetical protein
VAQWIAISTGSTGSSSSATHSAAAVANRGDTSVRERTLGGLRSRRLRGPPRKGEPLRNLLAAVTDLARRSAPHSDDPLARP